MKTSYIFTSESVNEGHPDKLCDIVSDFVLDACLKTDPHSKVACETAAKDNMVMVFGEITTSADLDYDAIVRSALKHIGYDDVKKGCDYKTCEVLVRIAKQSPDIAQGVHVGRNIDEVGAGDQGMMFGYASNETDSLLPLSYDLATKLGARLTEVRKNGTLPWVRPDGKTQVSVAYDEVDGETIPKFVDTVVISTQHDEDIALEDLRAALKEHVVKYVIPEKYITADTKYIINPTGRFVIGGPEGDAGLTGRKIIVDTYGGWGAHGGGAFSGKDPTKVDRSAAYAGRWVAKSLVANNLCKRCLVQVAYSIGVAEPVSIYVNAYGTSKYSDQELTDIVRNNFDLRPGYIVRDLDLLKPIYHKTTCYSHFGKPDLPWEKVKVLKY